MLELPERYVELAGMPPVADVVEHTAKVQRNFEKIRRDWPYAPVKTNGGVGSLTGDGSGAINVAFAHGLGSVPSSYIAMPIGWTGIMIAQTGADATNMQLAAVLLAGTFTVGSPYSFYWQARA